MEPLSITTRQFAEAINILSAGHTTRARFVFVERHELQIVTTSMGDDYTIKVNVVEDNAPRGAAHSDLNEHLTGRTWPSLQHHLIHDHGLSPAFVSYKNGPWASIHEDAHIAEAPPTDALADGADSETAGPLNVRKIGYPVEVQLDEDGKPMVLGERLVEVRPGEWMTPLGAALSTAAFPDQWLDGTEHAEPIGGHTVVMDDLVAWLTQIWDELEETARAAYYEGQLWLPEEEAVITAPDWDVVYMADRKVDARHIVEWQPAGVLARIAADRQILAHCVNAQVAFASIRETFADDDSTSAKVERAGYGQTANALLDVVRLLALPHADRPGYREEWRP